MAKKEKFVIGIRTRSRKTWSGILSFWNCPFLVSAILLVPAAFLTYLLVSQTFQRNFNCAYLLGSLGMNQLCTGVSIKIDVDLVNFHKSFPILPPFNTIDSPLEVFRKFIVWDIIIFFAVASLVLAFIVNKITGFVKFVLTPEGRKIILTHLSTWLFIFIILSTLFYLWVVR